MTTPAAALADADLVAVVMGHLRTDTDVVTALTGSPSGSAVAQVSARNQPPYPHLRVLDVSGGDLRTGRWLFTQSIQVEILGDPDGSGGKAALGRLARIVVGALAIMPEAAHVTGKAVVSGIDFAGGLGWAPEPAGQPRYVLTVNVTGHPPN
jgi:hypothetical protein